MARGSGGCFSFSGAESLDSALHDLLGIVAGRHVTIGERTELGVLGVTALGLSERATCVEAATLRWVGR